MVQNILHIVLSMGYGGLEKFVYNFIRNLDPNQFKISLCCLDRGGPVLDLIKTKIDIKTYILDRKPGKLDIHTLATLSQIVRKENIDVIHAHSGTFLYAAIAGKMGKARKTIYSDHGRLKPDRIGARIEDSVFSYITSQYVSVSPELTAYLKKTMWVRRNKIRTIVNGIDTNSVNC